MLQAKNKKNAQSHDFLSYFQQGGYYIPREKIISIICIFHLKCINLEAYSFD